MPRGRTPARPPERSAAGGPACARSRGVGRLGTAIARRARARCRTRARASTRLGIGLDPRGDDLLVVAVEAEVELGLGRLRLGGHRLDLDRVEVPLGVGAELGRRALAEGESVGEQRLVGGGAEVAADLAGDAAAQDRPQQLLDPAGDLRGAGAPSARIGSPLQSSRSSEIACSTTCLASPRPSPPSARAATRIGRPTPAGPSPSSRKRSASRWSLSASTAPRRSRPASKRSRARRRRATRRRVDGDGAREVGDGVEVVLGQAVAAGPRLAGSGRDPPPAVARDPDPAVRAEPDSAGLVEPQGRHDALEGAGDAVAGTAETAVLVERDAGADQEGGLPRGAAGALAAGGLGGDVDGIGADDRRAAEVEPRCRHLEADQRDDRLDLAGLGLGALLDLGDRRGEALVVDLEVRGRRPRGAPGSR